MKKLILIFAAIALFSCNNANKTTNSATSGASPTTDNALTAEKQKELTPDIVIDSLKKGNEYFSAFKPRMINDSLRIRQTATSQNPMAAVLSCLDSRVPVETVFHMGIGDLFVARVAGNIGNVDIWGSLEYATYVIKAKVIMVLGHEDCGAVKAAIDKYDGTKNITALLAKIRPAVDAVKEPTDTAQRKSTNRKFVHDVMVKNIELTIARMRNESKEIRELERDKKIKIIGGIYDVATGKIEFLQVGI
jgi:carbonic anhydrase